MGEANGLSRRIAISLVLLVVGALGWVTLGGWLWLMLLVVGLGTLVGTWIGRGGNDLYGPRSEYPVADDLSRSDDPTEQQPHPGPLPPQPPGW